MKFVWYIALSLFMIVLNGCGQNATVPSKVYGFSFVDGNIIKVSGDKVVVDVVNKDIVEGSSYIDKLANEVMKNSLFVVGMNTTIADEKAVVTDVRGSEVTLKVQNIHLKNEEHVKIYVPKKTIAVMDFSLIGIENKTMNKFAMEDMTTKLVQSGQYLVVERAKLNAILEEHKLADSGLLDEESSSKLGKLVSADIILTGTFAKRGSKWVVNLRLVDVQTGIILTAINETISNSEFRWEQQKDISNMSEDFEDNNLNLGWNISIINKNGSKSHGMIDNTTGANGTNGSYKIDYKFKRGKASLEFQNKRIRDVSAYKGISFYAKANESTTIRACFIDQNFDDTNENKWISPVNVGTKWKKYNIPFDSLALGIKYAKHNHGGDGKLDLDNISKFMIEIRAKEAGVDKKNSVWIDEISLY